MWEKLSGTRREQGDDNEVPLLPHYIHDEGWVGRSRDKDEGDGRG